MNDDITFELSDGVGVITFNRPDSLNTLSAAMISGLSELYRRCDADDAVRAVVVTGAGRAFCAGADLSSGGDSFSEQGADFSSCPLSFQAWDLRKPVIAACNGHAIGVGLGIASQCDLRVFAEEGKYSFRQVRLGVVADFAAHHTLPRLVGLEHALDLLLSGRTLSGAEALELGLASRAVPAGEVLEVALALARDMATHSSPLAMALSKRLLWRGADSSLAEMMQRETRALAHCMGRPDAVEGGMAFLERRDPLWSSSVSGDWLEDL